MPSFLGEDKEYIDFRDDFANAMDELVKFLKGIAREIHGIGDIK